MTTSTAKPKLKPKLYCNVMAQERGLDPVGYAGTFDDAVCVEYPLPWKRDVFSQALALPEAQALQAIWLEEYQKTGRYPHRPLLLAPDKHYSVPGKQRVIFYKRPDAPFATYQQEEFCVPTEMIGPLIWALFQERDSLPQFEPYRIARPKAARDLLICTHGSVDVACAKFGIPVFQYLQKTYGSESLRIWRVTHFGGHAFAPTLIDMPYGHYWAFVAEEQAKQIIEQNGRSASLRQHYRGWAGVAMGFLQAAEREMWQKEGWRWFGYRKEGEILAQDDQHEKPEWAEVALSYWDDAGVGHRYVARVALSRTIYTIGSSGEEKEYPYNQYVVTSLSQQAA